MRNMLVITLLLMGSLFAVFYVPVNNVAAGSTLSAYESMYAYFYTEDMEGFSKEDVEKMASNYGLEVENFREAELVQAVGSGVNRDNVDENGDLEEIYEEKYRVYEFISASDFERMTGQQTDIESGSYYMIQRSDAEESLFFHFDDMDQVYLDREDRFMTLQYEGNLNYASLVQGRGFDIEARFVVSDEQYDEIRR